MSFKKNIEYYWFQPYTPLFFIGVFLILLYQFGYPAFQKVVSPSPQNGAHPQVQGATSQKEILSQLAKLMTLPNDESPQIATITDPTALSDKPFFKNAQKGQKLIIYEKNRLAILFDQKEGKIIGVAPIAPTPTVNPELTQPATPASELQ